MIITTQKAKEKEKRWVYIFQAYFMEEGNR